MNVIITRVYFSIIGHIFQAVNKINNIFLLYQNVLQQLQ